MKSILIIILMALSIPSFGQTKADLVDCMALMFSHDEFQTAFKNEFITNGNLVILLKEGFMNQSFLSPAARVERSLTEDDFRDLDLKIKFVRERELDVLGIPNYAVLNLFASGDEKAITIRSSITLEAERQTYNWNYDMSKASGEWEITANFTNRQKAIISN